MDEMIRFLDQKRQEKGMSGNEFADYLGISRAEWSYLVNGKRRPGWKVRHKAAAKFRGHKALFFA
jgi:transcriptional regulator with XRE-family HTH domain